VTRATPSLRRFRPGLTALAPAGWFVRESIQISNGEGASVFASADFVTPETTLESYAREHGEVMSRELREFAELDLAETTLGVTPALLRRFRWTPEAGDTLTQLQLYAVEGGRAILATATAPADAFEGLEPVLLELLYGIELSRPWPGGPVRLWEESPRHAAYEAFVRGEVVVLSEEDGGDDWADARRAWAETLGDLGSGD
jgi:hypothetical protein